ncbi:Xre family transcriptional regulator [Bradyrhizobium macuxiense]|uniref:Xre family transcriptional regulator n=1 Tax=Bradyrhizobium macuxiense TaxID=1755647 RepID=A0A560LFQ5_9BRAD|nr:helix-turn-helix domain-containing protein [Bradyrhizobium macuxiense]TWB93214.1 Xre family transcriptional regulator [Bradyrhizobium macuxiense]
MEIRPIKNDEDHAAALAEIAKLWDAVEGSEDDDKLDLLATLVSRYEATRWPTVSNMDPIELLQFAIDELGHTQAELAELLGSRPRASEVLNRKRALSIEMIRKIHDAWKLPLELLIKPYALVSIAA